jgi:magnesium transporter
MANKKHHKASKIGLPPGTLVYIGEERTSPIRIREINFSPTHFEETELTDLTKSQVFKKDPSQTTWMNVDGVHNIERIETGGKFFNLDQLVLEDIVNTKSRPKFEDFESYLFLTMRILSVDKEKDEILNEQLSLLLGKSWVISLHENENKMFNIYKDRIKQAKGISRSRKEDFVFYRLIDITVDNYYHVSEFLAESIDSLEEKIIENRDENLNEKIYELKKKISFVRKSLIPLREAVSAIIRSDTVLIPENSLKYYHDVLDHVNQEIETIDTQREIVNEFLNLYMTSISNKMNDVMKVLTIFASIFIPLTFIAGIYGMNFEYMPELNSRYGYFIALGVMVAVAVALLIYFRRKKWI